MPRLIGEMSSSLVSPIGRRIGSTLGLPTDWSVDGWSVDAQRLNAQQQAIFDDGEPLNEWLEWWIQVGQSNAHRPAAQLVVLQPGWRGERRVEPLTKTSLQACFDSGASAIEGGFFLVWGLPVNGGISLTGKVRSARAVVAVAIDGCAGVLLCAPDERGLFAPQ